MAEEPGRPVLMLSDGLALSEGGKAQGEQVVLYGPDVGRGASSPRKGADALLFQEGAAQAGPASVAVGGVEVGYYETNDTHSDFYFQGSSGPSGVEAQGLFDAGIVDEESVETLYSYIHYSHADSSFAIGAFYYGGNLDQVASKLIYGGSNGVFLNPGNPVVQDDPDDGGNTDFYGTDSNGDSFGANRVGGGNGDGFMYQFPEGSYNFTFKYREHPNYPSYEPVEQIRFRGPEGTNEKNVPGYGEDFEYSISVTAPE